MKELPKMYQNKITKNISNNKKVFSSLHDKTLSIVEEIKDMYIDKKNNYTIKQKIYSIFNSPNYIYKMDVIIVTDENSYHKRIVGKTKTNLITFDGEYIPIDKIRDIYIKK